MALSCVCRGSQALISFIHSRTHPAEHTCVTHVQPPEAHPLHNNAATVCLWPACLPATTHTPLQVSDKERQAQQDNLFKDVAGVLVEKTVRSRQVVFLHRGVLATAS